MLPGHLFFVTLTSLIDRAVIDLPPPSGVGEKSNVISWRDFLCIYRRSIPENDFTKKVSGYIFNAVKTNFISHLPTDLI